MDHGFTVDAPALVRYSERTATMAEELERLAKRKIYSVQQIAEDTFGRAGKESGFTAALSHFAGALENQVTHAATNANTFGRTVARAAGRYQAMDRDSADDFGRSGEHRTTIH